MDFRDLAEHLERVEATDSRLEMAKRLAETFQAASVEETAPIAYLLLGRLAPEFEGVEVGLADKMVQQLILERTGASEEELEALMADEGDLGLVAERLWEERSGGQVALDAFGETETEAPTLLEVRETLVEIARTEGEGSQDKKTGRAMRLLDRVSPLEARYLVRFMVGTMRLGVADMTLLDGAAVAFADEDALEVGDDGLPRPPTELREALERAYNLTSDVGSAVETARTEGLAGLEAVQITLANPVRPMLAERVSDAEEIFENVGAPSLAEYKYDGLRLQAHVGEDTELFSRRLENVTRPYPDVVEALETALDVDEAVVEGEAVPVDPDTGRLREFQAIAKRRGRKHDLEEAIEEVPIHVYLFDVLYEDGEDLTVAPLERRRERLEAITGEHEAVHVSHARNVETEAELDAFFEDAVADGAEGLMVKKLGEDSHYEAGARGWRWVKYKKDYVDALADSLDLVVVGAYHGKGRRAGWYGTLLGAAYNPEVDRWETVCKVGTGFTDEDLEALDDVLDEHERATCSPDVACELEPDAWFEPVQVAEIRGAELTRSPVHTAARDDEGGIALRFPRFIRWREDKGPRDATTVEEVESMYHRQTKIEDDESED